MSRQEKDQAETNRAEFSWGPLQLQQRFDSLRLASALAGRFRTQLNADDRAFVEEQPFFFLATASAEGQPQCSYKGGPPGFVHVLAPDRLVFPSYDGNGMYLTAGNILENERVGLLFISFEAKQRLRLEGRARLDLRSDDGATDFWIEVAIEKVFANCERYIHDYQMRAHSEFVPSPGKPAPEPAWKQRPWLRKLLPNRNR